MATITDTVNESTATTDPTRLVICFAGDSGDGIQLLGQQFAESRHSLAEDFSTYADYPAEIRAPLGSLHGVSAYTVQFGSQGIFHAGDEADVLVAFNPAALRARLTATRKGGWVVIDDSSFTKRALTKAGYADNPLSDSELDHYQVLNVDVSRLTALALEPLAVTHRDAMQSRNMWVLGMLCEAYGRSGESVARWVATKFARDHSVRDRNLAAFEAGRKWCENTETRPPLPSIRPAKPSPVQSRSLRTISGSQAAAEGLFVGARLKKLGMLFASYPITPASPMLHTMARLAKDQNLDVVQAEDEIAACCMAIGASYGGKIGVTATSGPGLDLMAESLGLAAALELPLVVVDVQRAGPSTGMPTKPEQSDLLAAVFGRHGEVPLPVMAMSSPTDAFATTVEAVALAVRLMTPVIVLSDATIANTTQPWEPPTLGSGLYALSPKSPTERTAKQEIYDRDPEGAARPWRIPGQAGGAYRIGGLERDMKSGNISYDATNHAAMTAMRAKKMQAASHFFPAAEVVSSSEKHKSDAARNKDTIAVLTWGSVYGPSAMAVEQLHQEGFKVDHLVLRHLAPLPNALGRQLGSYRQVIVPEMNSGHLAMLLRATFGSEVVKINKITGQPFRVQDLVEVVRDVASRHTNKLGDD